MSTSANEVIYEASVHIEWVAVLCVVLLVAALILERGDHRVLRVGLLILFSIYLFCVLYITVIGRGYEGYSSIQLTPLWAYRLAWHQADRQFSNILPMLKGSILNILLFIPFGYLLPALSKGKKHLFLLIVVCAFLLSLSIESMQLVLQRGTFDVDDLFNNTLGAVIGLGVYSVLKSFIHG